MPLISDNKSPSGTGQPLSHQTKQVVLNVINFFNETMRKVLKQNS